MSFWSRNGWVVIFIVLTASLHFHFLKAKKEAFLTLNQKLSELEIQKEKSLQNQEELKLRINSQNDPAWIEMVLIRELGVVPEGFLKVHFQK